MSGRMDDPENQAARVFVGGVTPDTEEQVLIERFSKHGNVKGTIVVFSLFSRDSLFFLEYRNSSPIIIK